jgi:hypothetical protein
MTLDEYNTMICNTPPTREPSRRGDIHRRGNDPGKALVGDDVPLPEAPWLAYSMPVKNMQATAVVATPLDNLTGEDLSVHHACL